MGKFPLEISSILKDKSEHFKYLYVYILGETYPAIGVSFTAGATGDFNQVPKISELTPLSRKLDTTRYCHPAQNRKCQADL